LLAARSRWFGRRLHDVVTAGAAERDQQVVSEIILVCAERFENKRDFVPAQRYHPVARDGRAI